MKDCKSTISLRIFLISFIILLLLAATASADNSSGSSNLLYNGDFMIVGNDGIPEGWYTDAYLLDPGYTIYRVEEISDGHHTNAVSIQNVAKNDARIAQTVEVDPDSLYCLSGYILADHIEDGHGANLSIEGIYAFSEEIYDTQNEWKYIEYYGETGPDQFEITVFARLGGYSGMSKGLACFRDLQLVKTDTVPEDIIADCWFIDSDFDDEADDEWDDEEDGVQITHAVWPVLLILMSLYVMIVLSVIYVYRDGEKCFLAQTEQQHVPVVPFVLLAFCLRIVISFFVSGYSVDVNCFLSWGSTMAQYGPVQFYQNTGFCDYPPLYMYILGINSWISQITGTNPEWTRVIFRFIPSLCDVLGCWMLIVYIRKQTDVKNRMIDLILILMMFNPVFILNSSGWGQMDSVLCLLILAVAVSAVKGKWLTAVPLYVLSILIKPQALMLGFLGLTFMILAGIRNAGICKKILLGCLAGILLLVVCVLPFSIEQKPDWLFTLYWNTLSSYPYATVNTANLYYLLGGNWSKIDTAAHVIAPCFFAFLSIVNALYWYLYIKQQKYYKLEAFISLLFMLWFILCLVFRWSWTLTGIGAMTFSFEIVISLAIRKKQIQFLPYLGALLFILLYVFGIKMHERYLFPALLLLLYAWILHRDRRILYLLMLFSFTVFINEGIVLDNSIRFGAASGHLNSDTVWLADILSCLNVIGALAAVFIGYNIFHDKRPNDVKAIHSILPIKQIPEKCIYSRKGFDVSLHWNKWDTMILCSITMIFSLLSLTTLGSNKAPQSSWTSSDEEETIVFDLGEEKRDVYILYFAQVSREDFSFSQSDDCMLWSEIIPAEMDQQQCWKWKYVTQSTENTNGERIYYNSMQYRYLFSGRYIRLISGQIGLTLNEIIFRDTDGNIIPATINNHYNFNQDSPLYSNPDNLLDEQDTLEQLPSVFSNQEGEAQPSWWNSTYFDEIYHARTGYEFTKGTVPYETSHPPLGKVFISWCISLFGMTPFAWRLAGALAGILMLPGMYLLGKQLTKKTGLAAVACLLMALDCMHLTQTQIATIDSFPVLFIIYAFFFMLRFIQTDLSHSSMKKVLIPLAFSGVSMGLAIASKWIGIYAGIGLAILFFRHCIRSYYYTEEADKALILKKMISLCLWCVLFFIIIPLAIYIISYIPYMAYNTKIKTFGDYLSAIWQSQLGMFNYHSTPGLGMDHPFYSPWWEWPIIGRPMYYASEQYYLQNASYRHSIFCFGNPVIWFGSIASMMLCLIRWVLNKRYQIGEEELFWHLKGFRPDDKYIFVFFGFLAQYLPWVLVPRGTYIYHYFASIPFMILSIILCFDGFSSDYEDGNGTLLKKGRIAVCICYCILVMVFFVILLPYVTGIPVSTAWLDLGKNILRIWY